MDTNITFFRMFLFEEQDAVVLEELSVYKAQDRFLLHFEMIGISFYYFVYFLYEVQLEICQILIEINFICWISVGSKTEIF